MLLINLLTNAKVMAMASLIIHKNKDIHYSSAYFDNIYGQFIELSKTCCSVFLIFFLPYLTKSFIITILIKIALVKLHLPG